MMVNLKVNQAVFGFGDGMVKALPDVSISFNNLLVIKGRIGSGKTLILKSLGGAMFPDEGELSAVKNGVALDGIYVHSQPEFNFVTGFVGDELSFAGVNSAGFEKFLHRDVNGLSGGELKKLALMIALRSGKELVLLDEPLDMMDDEQSFEMAAYIIEKSQKVPVIVATHDNFFDDAASVIDLGAGELSGRCEADLISLRNTILRSSLDVYGNVVFKCDGLSVKMNGESFPELSMELREGEIKCLLGRNGTGKTLFLRTVCGIGRYPYSGTFQWKTFPGVCLQFPEHMIYNSTIEREISDIAGEEHTRAVLKFLGWEKRRLESPFGLSDGEKRIMYIISVLKSCPCCVFDEPFAGLDENTSAYVADIFVKAADSGKAVLYTANRSKDSYVADSVIEVV